MVKNRKHCLKNMKGRMALIITGLSTGILMMSGCNVDAIESVDDKSEVILSEIPSEEVSEVQSEEVSEEVSEVIAEEDPYQHIPEDLLDENGKYHPAEVTADMLRERFADLNKFANDHNYPSEGYTDLVMASIMRANYSFMSDDTFKEIVNEYKVPVNNFNNRMYYYEYEDYSIENYYFDPYLQYTARKVYDLEYKVSNEYANGNQDVADEYYEDMRWLLRSRTDLPIYMDGSNIYEKTDFTNSTSTYEIAHACNVNAFFSGSLASDWMSMFTEIAQDPKIKVK